ncbi:unnamed protein product [Heterobilharzia americana]|nr:unnamed protein product [Heterobilharzia americana]
MSHHQSERPLSRSSTRATRQNNQNPNCRKAYLDTNSSLYANNYYATSSTTTSPSLQRKQLNSTNKSPSSAYYGHKSTEKTNYTSEYQSREYRLPTNGKYRLSGTHDFIHLSLPGSEAYFSPSEVCPPTSLHISSPPFSTTATTATTNTYRPNLNTLGRASSFGGHSTSEFDDNGTIHQTVEPKLYSVRQIDTKSRINKHMSNTINNSNTSTTGSSNADNDSAISVTRRGHLVVTPSIEISLVDDDTVSEEQDKKFTPEHSSYLTESRRRRNSSRQQAQNILSSSLQVDFDTNIDDLHYQYNINDSTDRMRNRTVSSQHISPQNELKVKSDSSAATSSSSTSGGGRRGKLIRQSRSFNNPTDNYHTCSSDTNSDNNISNLNNHNKPASNLGSVMDDFDYFCRIANVPRDQENSENKSKNLHPFLSASNMRSNSMREYGVERQKSISGYTSSTEVVSELDSMSNDSKLFKRTRSNKSSFLKPPVKGQLRRASTEEDPLNKSSLNKRPVAATLSYTSMTSSYSNLCTTPPRNIPSVPIVMDDIANPTVPLGVPLSSDSMFADEPGLTFYQVQVLGSSGVGKTSLCHQLAALVRGNSQECDLDEMDNQSEVYSITTALCGSVYTVNFVDSSADNFEKNLEVQIRDCIDAFLVVYAIDDQNSFEAARLIINALTPLNDRRQFSMLSPKKMNNSVTTLPGLIYLVANKSDLVRGRQVPSDEGRHLAAMHGAKFIEVSASLNHMVADLFVLLIGHLHESEQRDRDPRLPTDRRTNPLQASMLANSSKTVTNTNIVNTFKIPAVTKASFSKFLRKHFTRSSQESE